MTNREEIIITIDEQGNTTLEVRGVKGKRCISLTEFIEQELGRVQKRRRKPEYYQSEQVVETINRQCQIKS
jgi:hypothetical protein